MTPKHTLALAGLISVAAAAIGGGISGVSWGAQRLDLFGFDSKKDVFHKYYTAFGWGPTDAAHGNLELFTNASVASPLSSVSWGPNRMDFFFVDTNGSAAHKYWDGSSWGPDGAKGYDILGANVEGKLAVTSWGADRFDVFGKSAFGTYVHKAWTGSEYYPPGIKWEDFGGEFISPPAAVSWGKNRLDVFGINGRGEVLHKYWDGYNWGPSFDKWENLGGKDFNGTLTASSPAEGRFDVWAVSDDTGELWHLFWDGYQMNGWESLGGNFTNAPEVIHWAPYRIDLVGKDATNSTYKHKYWDGRQWNGWHDKGGPFASQPAVVNIGPDNLNIFGIDKDGKLKIQVWDGAQWLPSPTTYNELGNTVITSSSTVGSFVDSSEKILNAAEKFIRIELRV